jgi:hypothetical protein
MQNIRLGSATAILLANDAILLACQFCDRLLDRINDFICFRGIDFV